MPGFLTGRLAPAKLIATGATLAAVLICALAMVSPSVSAASSAKAYNPVLYDDGRDIDALGTVTDSQRLTKACVTLWWGKAIGFGWNWSPYTSHCVTTPGGGVQYVLHAGRDRCNPGIWYAQAQGFDGDQEIVEDKSDMIDTACNPDNW
jgi:hypothetical protein